jgi:hypothetical protein
MEKLRFALINSWPGMLICAVHLAAPVGEDPAPSNAHAVVLHTHGLHQRHILLKPDKTTQGITQSNTKCHELGNEVSVMSVQ